MRNKGKKFSTPHGLLLKLVFSLPHRKIILPPSKLLLLRIPTLHTYYFPSQYLLTPNVRVNQEQNSPPPLFSLSPALFFVFPNLKTKDIGTLRGGTKKLSERFFQGSSKTLIISTLQSEQMTKPKLHTYVFSIYTTALLAAARKSHGYGSKWRHDLSTTRIPDQAILRENLIVINAKPVSYTPQRR